MGRTSLGRQRQRQFYSAKRKQANRGKVSNADKGKDKGGGRSSLVTHPEQRFNNS